MVNDHVPPLPCSTLMALPSASVTSMDVTFLPASGFTVSVTFSPGATLLVSTVTWPPSTCSMETTLAQRGVSDADGPAAHAYRILGIGQLRYPVDDTRELGIRRFDRERDVACDREHVKHLVTHDLDGATVFDVLGSMVKRGVARSAINLHAILIGRIIVQALARGCFDIDERADTVGGP